MADSFVNITTGVGPSKVDFATESTNSSLRQVVVLGDPTAYAAEAAITNADPSTSAYGLPVRPINLTRGNNLVNASMQISGVDVSNTVPVPVGGTIASGVADSGNPVKVGGKYNASSPSLTDGQRVDAQMDVNGNTKVTLATVLSSLVSGVETDSILFHPGRRADAFQASINFASATAQTVKAATGGKSIYITELYISSDGGAAANVTIQDNAGSPAVLVNKTYLPASAVTVPFRFTSPIQVANGNALNAISSSATPNITVTAVGYVI